MRTRKAQAKLLMRFVGVLTPLALGSIALYCKVHAAPSPKTQATALTTPAAPPTLPVVNQNSLEQDKRLDRTVTVEKVGIPLNELLQSLSNGGLKLDAARSCDGQKLQIRLKQKSLRVVMQSLAELLPGEWLALDDHSGYRLRLADQAVRRRQRWWNLWMAERDKALAAQRAFILQEIRGEMRKTEEFNISPELHERLAQDHDFFRVLTPALQEQLAARMNEDTFYQQGGGIETGMDEGAILVSVSELSEAARRMVQNNIMHRYADLSAEPDWTQTYVVLLNGGSGIMADTILPDGRYSGLFGRSMYSFASEMLGPDHAQFLKIVQNLGKQAPEGWKQLAAYQQSRVWPNDPPAKPADHNQSVWNRADMLQRLGYAAGMEYVADYYSRPGRQMPAKVKTAPWRSLYLKR